MIFFVFKKSREHLDKQITDVLNSENKTQNSLLQVNELVTTVRKEAEENKKVRFQSILVRPEMRSLETEIFLHHPFFEGNATLSQSRNLLHYRFNIKKCNQIVNEYLLSFALLLHKESVSRTG